MEEIMEQMGINVAKKEEDNMEYYSLQDIWLVMVKM